MPAYLIGQMTIRHADNFAQYAEGVARSLEPFGARVLFRGVCHQVLAGTLAHDRSVVIQFADQQTLQAWFSSAAYQALIPLRDEAADVTLASYNA